MRRLIYITFLASTAGCIFSSGTDLPNTDGRDVAGVEDVGTSDVRDLGARPGDTGSNDAGRSDADGGPIADTGMDVGVDMERDTGEPPITVPLMGAINPTQIRLLDSPFQIFLMNTSKTEVWDYNPVTQAATPDIGATPESGSGGTNLAVARVNAGTPPAEFLLSTGSRVYECDPTCVPRDDTIVGVGVDSMELFTVAQLNDGSWRISAATGQVELSMNEGVYSIRSFPTGEGAILITKFNSGHHYISNGVSCKFTGTRLRGAIPIHGGHFLGLNGVAGERTLRVSTTHDCEATQPLVLTDVAHSVLAFDAYRFGESTYVAYSTLNEVNVVKFNDDFTTTDIETIPVRNADIVSIAADANWFLIVTKQQETDALEIHQLRRLSN